MIGECCELNRYVSARSIGVVEEIAGSRVIEDEVVTVVGGNAGRGDETGTGEIACGE